MSGSLRERRSGAQGPDGGEGEPPTVARMPVDGRPGGDAWSRYWRCTSARNGPDRDAGVKVTPQSQIGHLIRSSAPAWRMGRPAHPNGLLKSPP